MRDEVGRARARDYFVPLGENALVIAIVAWTTVSSFLMRKKVRITKKEDRKDYTYFVYPDVVVEFRNGVAPDAAAKTYQEFATPSRTEKNVNRGQKKNG